MSACYALSLRTIIAYTTRSSSYARKADTLFTNQLLHQTRNLFYLLDRTPREDRLARLAHSLLHGFLAFIITLLSFSQFYRPTRNRAINPPDEL